MKSFTRDILVTAVIAILAFFLMRTSIESIIINGSSMEPNVLDGQRLLVNKLVYYFHQPERGDIIVLQPPNNQGGFIKRIIGLPRDTVEVKNSSVYVNGKKLYEPYIKDLPLYDLALTKISENNYFVLGDNRNDTYDSHYGWTVPRQNIIGKAWLRIWPPKNWGLIPHYPLQEQLTWLILRKDASPS